MKDLRQTEEWGRFLESCGWVVKKLTIKSHRPRRNISPLRSDPPRRSSGLNPPFRVRPFCYVFIKKIPLTPVSIMKMQRFEGELDWGEFNKLKRKYKVIYSISEPVKKSMKWKKIDSYLPTKTLVIDLKKTKGELWKDLSENARRMIKKENGVVIKKVREERFLREWKKANKIWSWEFNKLKKLVRAFENRADLLVSKNGKKWLSGLVILRSADMVFYFQTWTNEEGRGLGAHYKLVWEAILSAKAEGLTYFDFEGIDDSRSPRKSWVGFSEFKKKFGGEEISFPGCFGRWL